MKANKLFALLLMTMSMGMMACGGDNDDPIVNPAPTPTPPPNPDPIPDSIELTAENIAKYVSATISYNSDGDLYTANIQSTLANSPLASKIAGKEVKYGLKVSIVMDDWLENYYSYDYYFFSIYSIEFGDNPAYVTGTNNSYDLSVKNPGYYGIKAQNRHSSRYEEEWLDVCEGDFGNFIIWRSLINEIEQHIKDGRASEEEYVVLEQLRANYNELSDKQVSYSEGRYTHCSSIAKVFIEIDGETYLIKEKADGPIHLLTYEEWAKDVHF